MAAAEPTSLSQKPKSTRHAIMPKQVLESFSSMSQEMNHTCLASVSLKPSKKLSSALASKIV
eukprot:scaffold1239_cov73-Skeletonema_dohrnii-CCMP3373.AAC.1